MGYHLVLVKARPDVDVSALTRAVHAYVPGAVLRGDVGAEVAFTLPAEDAPRFPDLFESLEERCERLGVESMGVSVTTMEDVFMR